MSRNEAVGVSIPKMESVDAAGHRSGLDIRLWKSVDAARHRGCADRTLNHQDGAVPDGKPERDKAKVVYSSGHGV
jgi:hypothetical protein